MIWNLPCGIKFFAGSNICVFSSDLQKQIPENKNYCKQFSHKNCLQGKYQEMVSVQLQLVSFIQKQNSIQWKTGFT